MDGLPQLGTNALAQDSDGYLWFGSLSGLSRFDGNSFTNFFPSTTPALQSSRIRALQSDSKGRLWIGTARGLTLYRHGSFSAPPGQTPATAPPNVEALALTPDDRLLVGSNKGLHVYTDGKGLQLLGAIGPVTAIAADSENIWAGSAGTVYRFNGNGVSAYPFPASPTQTLISLAVVNGTVWATTQLGVYRLEGGQWVVLHDPNPSSTQFRRVFKGENDTLWVIEASRLRRVESAAFVEELTLAPEFPHLAYGMLDRDGSLWLTSANAGVMRLWPGVAWHFPLKDAPVSPLVWTTTRLPDGNVLAGGVEGIRVVRNGQLEPYIHDDNLASVYTLMAEGEQLWAGTIDGAVLYRNGRRVPVPALDALRHIRVNAFLRSADGNLWLATDEGVHRLDKDSQHLVRLRTPANLKQQIMRVMLQRRDGQLLVGGEEGLFQVSGDELVRMPLPLSDPAVFTLHELPSGELLLGSRSQEGVSVLVDDRWVHIGAKKGLPALHIPYSITTDGAGSVLVSGFQGVYQIKESELLAVAHDSSQWVHAQILLSQNNRVQPGQRAQCCNGGGLGRGFVDAGKLWVPASDGLYRIDVGINGQAHVVPTVLIERVQVGDEWRQVTNDGDWALPAHARDLRFEFNILSFDPLHSVHARYRLTGYDAQWRESGSSTDYVAQYTNLPPGFYTFEVTGTWDGKTTAASSRLSFEIKPYFYETPLFKVLLAAGLLLVGALLAKVISLWLQRRRATLERLIKSRTQELDTVNRELDSISRTDELTGLYNRRHVIEQIPRDLATRQRALPLRQDTGVTLFALIDIDHFKAINDTFGHQAGDEVLAEVARRLSSQMRVGDYIARWGGEEFLAVLHGHNRGRHAAVANRMLECIRAQPFQIGEEKRTITVSIGMTELPVFANAPDLWSWEQSLWLADMAMYGAKRAGRNGWAIYQPASTDTLPARDASPRLAIARNDLVLQHSERAPSQD